eukprot:GHRQ01036551.1.p1 GENE.GHRQ01036551.1~~GHRQ01036551.1.p1  ORF type:complete len:181 (-),score=21.57 GHRQ01036551.1:104-646(-)
MPADQKQRPACRFVVQVGAICLADWHAAAQVAVQGLARWQRLAGNLTQVISCSYEHWASREEAPYLADQHVLSLHIHGRRKARTAAGNSHNRSTRFQPHMQVKQPWQAYLCVLPSQVGSLAVPPAPLLCPLCWSDASTMPAAPRMRPAASRPAPHVQARALQATNRQAAGVACQLSTARV